MSARGGSALGRAERCARDHGGPAWPSGEARGRLRACTARWHTVGERTLGWQVSWGVKEPTVGPEKPQRDVKMLATRKPDGWGAERCDSGKAPGRRGSRKAAALAG